MMHWTICLVGPSNEVEPIRVLSFIVGNRIFAIKLDDGVCVPKVAKGYGIALSEQLTFKITSENLVGLSTPFSSLSDGFESS